MKQRSLLSVAVGGMTAMVVAGLLVPVRGLVGPTNVALVLAVVVIVAAAAGGRLSGGVTAVLGAVSFDFAHTRPYGSLKIANLDDLVTTILLVVLGVVAGELAERLQEVKHRRSPLGELQRLHRVAARASFGDTTEDLTLQVAAELIDALLLRDCWYEPAPFATQLPYLHPDGTVSTRVHRWAGDDFELPAGLSLPVTVGGRTVGRFVLVTTRRTGVSIERRLIAVALVDQLSLVLALRAA